MPSQLREGAKRVSIVVDADEWDKAKETLRELGGPRDMLSHMLNDYVKLLNVGLARVVARKREGKPVRLADVWASMTDLMLADEADEEGEQ